MLYIPGRRQVQTIALCSDGVPLHVCVLHTCVTGPEVSASFGMKVR